MTRSLGAMILTRYLREEKMKHIEQALDLEPKTGRSILEDYLRGLAPEVMATFRPAKGRKLFRRFVLNNREAWLRAQRQREMCPEETAIREAASDPFGAAPPHDPIWKDRRWQMFATEVKVRDMWTCRRCKDSEGPTQPLSAHHTYYVLDRRPWDYPLDSMEALCEPCHAKARDAKEAPYFSEEAYAAMLEEGIDPAKYRRFREIMRL